MRRRWRGRVPTGQGVEHIYVRGEIELHMRAERQRDGIPVEPATWHQIEQICRLFGIDAGARMRA